MWEGWATCQFCVIRRFKSTPAASFSFPYWLAIIVAHIIYTAACFICINPMASIVSSLSIENEFKLRGFFSRPVCFHLLYKSSHRGASIQKLLDRFETHGKYLLIVFLKSRSIRGAFMSQSLEYEKEYRDEWFVFKMNDNFSNRFPEKYPKAVTVCVSPSMISFGNDFNINLQQGCWYGSFCSGAVRGYSAQQENNICCTDLELHRVEGTFYHRCQSMNLNFWLMLIRISICFCLRSRWYFTQPLEKGVLVWCVSLSLSLKYRNCGVLQWYL